MVNEVLLKEWWDDLLDDSHPEVEVMGRKYSPSVAFYRLDPIAYQVRRMGILRGIVQRRRRIG